MLLILTPEYTNGWSSLHVSKASYTTMIFSQLFSVIQRLIKYLLNAK